MTDINKQKFLTELGKLLTFMYEEDRQTALALYERMFDKAQDEMALLQLLVSPTRQAVVVARAYNAKEHKLEVYSQSREGDAPAASGEMPDFVRAINQIYQSAVSQRIIAPDVTSGQFTLFSDDDTGLTEAYAYEEASVAPVPAPAASVIPAPAPVPAPPEAQPAAAPELPADPAVDPVIPAPVQPAAMPEPPEEVPLLELDEQGQPALVPAGPEEAPLTEALAPAEAPVAAPAAPEAETPAGQEEAPLLQLDDTEEPKKPAEAEEPTPPGGTVRKPKTFLLILYILAAVPVTALGVLVLLIPTLLCLVLAVSVLGAGVVAFMAAFSGFRVLADILVVLGGALVILALGLLFLWLFIWLVGGAIAGLIRGVLSLGSRWCYKEVPAV